MSFRSIVTLSLVAILTFLTTSANAKESAQPQATDNSGKQEDSKSPADIAFEPIARDINVLYKSLQAKGGIEKNDHPIIAALRDRAVEFSRQFPKDQRGVAAELQLSIWLKDDARVDAIYERILKESPDNTKVRLSWAKRLKAENRYTEALDLMKAYTWDPAKDPEAFTVLSECLFSENRFQEALDAFNAIPNSVLDKMENRLVKQEIDQLRKPREEYIEFWKKEQELRQKEESADDLPRVLLVTSRGAIVTELFENEAPNTVANFIHLADSGFFNGTKFHRVIPNFMAQGGDPFSKEGATGSPGQGDPGYFIEDEHTRPDHRLHFAGSLSMANTGARNTGGSQFFITVTPTHWLNGKHTVFGRVIQGMDVARSIKKDDLLQSVTVLRRRDHAYIPVTLPSPNAPATQPASTQPQSTTEASATQPSG